MDFVDAKIITLKIEYSKDKVTSLIAKFNDKIKAGEEEPDGSFFLNSTFDRVEKLNTEEFNTARLKAAGMSWILTQHMDSYNSLTYRLRKM